MVKRLVRLFRNNMQKLHKLPESMISNKGLEFVVGLMKELNKILGIKIKLSTAFHPQTDKERERENKSRAGTILKNVH